MSAYPAKLGFTVIDRRSSSGPRHVEPVGEVRVIPENWAAYRRERLDYDREARWFACLARKAVLTQSGRDGESVGVMIAYVREDATRAFERTYPSVQAESGLLPAPSRYRSVVGEAPDYGQPIGPDAQGVYQEILGDRYEVDGGER